MDTKGDGVEFRRFFFHLTGFSGLFYCSASFWKKLTEINQPSAEGRGTRRIQQEIHSAYPTATRSKTFSLATI